MDGMAWHSGGVFKNAHGWKNGLITGLDGNVGRRYHGPHGRGDGDGRLRLLHDTPYIMSDAALALIGFGFFKIPVGYTRSRDGYAHVTLLLHELGGRELEGNSSQSVITTPHWMRCKARETATEVPVEVGDELGVR
jgi:hypothetical protein